MYFSVTLISIVSYDGIVYFYFLNEVWYYLFIYEVLFFSYLFMLDFEHLVSTVLSFAVCLSFLLWTKIKIFSCVDLYETCLLNNHVSYFFAKGGSGPARGEFERLSVPPGEGQYTTVSLTPAATRRARLEER